MEREADCQGKGCATADQLNQIAQQAERALKWAEENPGAHPTNTINVFRAALQRAAHKGASSHDR